MCNVSLKFVQTTLKNHELHNDVKDLPSLVRPLKLTSRDQSYLYRKVRQDPKISYRELAEGFTNTPGNVIVSRWTVQRCLNKKGLDCYVAARKPLLRVSDRLKRLKWCRERLHWFVEDWAKVIFCNLSNFEVKNRKSRLIIKRLADEKFKERFCVPRIQGGGGSVGIWGCFSHKGRGSYNIYNGRINQYNYKKTLESKLLPKARPFYGRRQQWIFQHDGATAHTAISLKEWLDWKNFTIMPWPARSPDLIGVHLGLDRQEIGQREHSQCCAVTAGVRKALERISKRIMHPTS